MCIYTCNTEVAFAKL